MLKVRARRKKGGRHVLYPVWYGWTRKSNGVSGSGVCDLSRGSSLGYRSTLCGIIRISVRPDPSGFLSRLPRAFKGHSQACVTQAGGKGEVVICAKRWSVGHIDDASQDMGTHPSQLMLTGVMGGAYAQEEDTKGERFASAHAVRRLSEH